MAQVISTFRTHDAPGVLHRTAGIGPILPPAFMAVLDLVAQHRGRAWLQPLSRPA